MVFKDYGMSNSEASGVFDQIFGKAGIKEDEIYYGGLNAIREHNYDKKSFVESVSKYGKNWMEKAPSFGHTSGGTSTVYGLMPSFFDPIYVDRTIRLTPLLGMLPRRAVRGRSYVYNAMTAKAVPTNGTAGSGFKPADSALSEDVDTWTTNTVTMKFAYVVGRVVGPAQVAAEGFMNLMAEDVRIKAQAMNEILENEIINGNASSNANGFTGLISSITTNAANNTTAAITLDLIRTDLATVFNANGIADIAVTDAVTFNVIKGLLMDFQRNMLQPSPLMAFGIPDAFELDGTVFIKDRFMPTTATQRRILYLDLRYVFLATLLDVTYEELAKVNDSQKYMLKWYGSLVVTAEGLMAQRYNIA